MKQRYDVVVIGSGFGGAITACRLAQAGNSVAILEQGRRWQRAEFPRTMGEVSSRAFWQPGRYPGFLEYRVFPRMDVIQGVGLGGGSLHYFNVHLRAAAEVFEGARWPASITRSGLDPYYDIAQAMMESSPLTPPRGLELPSRTVLFLNAAKQTKMSHQSVPIAVYTGAERENPWGRGVQRACTYCGACLLGCTEHSKNSVDLTYIGFAERRYGAEVFTLHQVDTIEPLEIGYKVSFRVLDAGDALPRGTGVVYADRVVLSAGSLGSTEILLRSREQGCLPKLAPSLGRNFSGNGDFIGAGALDTKLSSDPGRGPSITAQVDASTDEHRITIEDLGFPDSMLWFIEGVMPPRQGRLRRLLELAGRYVAASFGFGRRRGPLGEGMDALFAETRTPRFLPYLGMGMDAADGTLRLDNGDLDLIWKHKASRKMFDAMQMRMAELSQAAGGRYVTSPLWRWPMRKLLTAHPLGGCVMGDDPERSVVNANGEVHQYPGLFVIDGAMIPSALAVNPSLTIAALAERSAWWMVHHRDIRADEASALKNDFA